MSCSIVFSVPSSFPVPAHIGSCTLAPLSQKDIFLTCEKQCHFLTKNSLASTIFNRNICFFHALVSLEIEESPALESQRKWQRELSLSSLQKAVLLMSNSPNEQCQTHPGFFIKNENEGTHCKPSESEFP